MGDFLGRSQIVAGGEDAAARTITTLTASSARAGLKAASISSSMR